MTQENKNSVSETQISKPNNAISAPSEPTQGVEPENPIFKEGESNIGPIVGSIIVIIVIIIGGLYFWNTVIQDRQEQIDEEETIDVGEEDATGAEGRSFEEYSNTPGTVSGIEAELNSADLNNLDAELDSIDAEFDNL